MAVSRNTMLLLFLVSLAACAHAAGEDVYANTDEYWNYYDETYLFSGPDMMYDMTDLHKYTETDVFVSSDCNTTVDCMAAVHGFSICVKANITDAGVTTEENRCACDVDIGYSKNGDNCTYGALLGELCTTDLSTCFDTKADCQEDGTNTGQRRCLCNLGSIEVRQDDTDPPTYMCIEMLHTRLDPACRVCENNDGFCYDSDGDGSQDGCVCPASRSGDVCQNENVKVVCDVTNFRMYVCYEPHLSINFTTGAVMHVDGLLKEPACRGFETPAGDPHCDADTYKMILPLEDDERDRCDTIKVTPDTDTVKYENKLAVHQDHYSLTMHDIIFKTYCSFEKFSDGSFQALGVISINRNDRGQHKAPTLTMDIENLLGKRIPKGVSLRLGDKIRMRIKLKDDGTYSAIRVLRCTASTKPTVPDPKAITIPLIINSCPYPRQRVINYKNTWARVSDNEVQTGAVTVFKMAQGDSVHLHCAIKLCLTGSEEECAPVQCRTPHNFAGYGRKKREAGEQDDESLVREARAVDYWDETAEYNSPGIRTGGGMDVMVSRELLIMDGEDDNTAIHGNVDNQPPYLLIVLGIVIVLVFMLVLVAVVLFRRLTRQLREPLDDDDSTSTLTLDTDTTSIALPYTPEATPKKGDRRSSDNSSGFGSPGNSVEYNTATTDCMIMRDTPEHKLITNC